MFVRFHFIQFGNPQFSPIAVINCDKKNWTREWLFSTPKKNTVCTSDLKSELKLRFVQTCVSFWLWCMVVPMFRALLGCSFPLDTPSFLPFAKSFPFLNICQSQDIWDSHFTRKFSAPAMHVGFCYGKIYQHKKEFYLLTSFHEANWNFYFHSSSEFSYLNVHYFYSDMQISSANPNLKIQFLLYTC